MTKTAAKNVAHIEYIHTIIFLLAFIFSTKGQYYYSHKIRTKIRFKQFAEISSYNSSFPCKSIKFEITFDANDFS